MVNVSASKEKETKKKDSGDDKDDEEEEERDSIVLDIKKHLESLEEVKKDKPDKAQLVEGLNQLTSAQVEKVEGVFEKLKKHLPPGELEQPKRKALECLRDLLRWVKTALKKGGDSDERDDNKINKVDKRRMDQRLREELHVWMRNEKSA